jgi:hypothetical protein
VFDIPFKGCGGGRMAVIKSVKINEDRKELGRTAWKWDYLE